MATNNIDDDQLDRYIDTCRRMSDDGDGGTYRWWADLTTTLEELRERRAGDRRPDTGTPVSGDMA